MNKNKKIDKAKSLLEEAIFVLGGHQDQNVMEARSNLRRAISKLDQSVKKRQKSQSQDSFSEWWGNIETGTASMANSPMTPEAHAKSLSQINQMIKTEQDKLGELEKEQNKTNSNKSSTELLND